MYRYIRGRVAEKGKDSIVIENSGIGYSFLTSISSLNSVQIGDEIKLYCVMIVREDEISLCGFLDDEERCFFEYLTGVSGIGKKNAITMLGFASYLEIVDMIIRSDEKKLSTLPSVGKKTAQRLILELREKMIKKYGEIPMGHFTLPKDDKESVNSEVVMALKNLGFRPSEIAQMLSGLDVQNKSVEEMITMALLRK